MAGNSRIWRDLNTVHSTDVVEFNSNAAKPDTTGAIMQSNIDLIKMHT